MQPAIETETQNSQSNRKLKPYVHCHFCRMYQKEAKLPAKIKLYNFALKDGGTLKLAIKKAVGLVRDTPNQQAHIPEKGKLG